MASTVHWRLMFRVGNRAAFDKCLARALAALGPGGVAGEGRPYWKMPELWECPVESAAPAGAVADQVLGALLAAYRLASGWHLTGSLSADSAIGFGGVFAEGHRGASARVVGLAWASFELAGATDAAPGTSLGGDEARG
jgi:hypothetical protein